MKRKETWGKNQSCPRLAQNQEAEQTEVVKGQEEKLPEFLFSTQEEELKYLQMGCLN